MWGASRSKPAIERSCTDVGSASAKATSTVTLFPFLSFFLFFSEQSGAYDEEGGQEVVKA